MNRLLPCASKLRRLAVGVAVIATTFVVVLAALSMLLLRALTPQAGEWSVLVQPVRMALAQRDLSVPVLLRWASHPLVLPLLDGRSLRTKAGTWFVAVDGHGDLRATCQPCVLRLPEVGPAPLTLDRVVVHAQRSGPEAWVGTVALGSDDAVSITWRAKLQRDGLAWHAALAPTPVASLLAVVGDAVPEAKRARVEGSFAFEASALLNQHGFTKLEVRPHLDALVVDGLGTDTLATAAPPARCTPTRERIDGWLPRAVVAAEDQRFFEHVGFDLVEALHAWADNRDRAPGTSPRGASTLTQQLAKLVYVGDGRSAARKLREWLYAVEMERTLGKGRILQLYLALAPWGHDVCGAEAAARRWLGKPAHQLARTKPRGSRAC